MPFFVWTRFSGVGILAPAPALLLGGIPSFHHDCSRLMLEHEFGSLCRVPLLPGGRELPYFLPAPTFTGTVGASSAIRAPIYTKRVLFDVGVAGPSRIRFLLPAGPSRTCVSKVIPGLPQGGLQLSTTACVWLLRASRLSGRAYIRHLSDIPSREPHGLAFSGDRLNLLTIGQLDGRSHSVPSQRTAKGVQRFVADGRDPMDRGIFDRTFSPPFLGGWVDMGRGALIFGMRHRLYDPLTLSGRAAKKMAWLSMLIFLLCFTLALSL